MIEFEGGYANTPSLPIKHPSEHIKHLEALLKRQEKALELARVFIRVNEANPNKYSDLENECKQDAEALRYAIDVVKWLNREGE